MALNNDPTVPLSLDALLNQAKLGRNQAAFVYTGESETVVQMARPKILLDAITRATGSVPEEEIEPGMPLTTCTLAELCGSDHVPAANISKECRDRIHYTRVGEWSDPSGLFTFTLAFSHPSQNPIHVPETGWYTYTPNVPVIIIKANVENFRPHENILTIEEGFCYLAEPEDLVLQKGFTPEVKEVFKFSELEFTYAANVHVQTVYDRELKRVLDLFDTNFKHPRYELRFDVAWRQDITCRPDLSGIVQVLRVPELLQTVCRSLDLQTVKSLRKTCKLFRTNLSSVALNRLRYLLERVFGEHQDTGKASLPFILEFQVILRRTGAVVGGSTPLHVLCPGTWVPGDLDVVVEESQAKLLEEFFVRRAGFTLNEERSHPDNSFFYPGGGISNTEFTGSNRVMFAHRHFDNPVEDRPGLDLCVLSPRDYFRPYHFVFTYHSTAVMNFWDGHYIHCFWPELTFNNLLIRNRYTPTDKVNAAIRKYVERGWKDKYDPHGDLTPARAVPKGIILGRPRYIQDIYPASKGTALKIEHIPKPRWREPLTFTPDEDELNASFMASLAL